MPPISGFDARPGNGRAEEHGVHLAAPGLGGQRGAQPPRKARLVAHVGGQQAVVPLGQAFGQARREPGSSGAAATKRAPRVPSCVNSPMATTSAVRRRAIRRPRRLAALRAVDLVDEQQGGDAEAP